MPRTARKNKTRKTRKQNKIQKGGANRADGTNVTMMVKYPGIAGSSNILLDSLTNEKNDLTDIYKTNKQQLMVAPVVELSRIEHGGNYILIMTDPNALGRTWTHWVVSLIKYDNDADNKKMENNKKIRSADGNRIYTFKFAKYIGPSPPADSGVHNYEFRLYNGKDLTVIPRPLESDERGTYYNDVIVGLFNKGTRPLAEVTFTIDSDRL